jgi:hypothetical protein
MLAGWHISFDVLDRFLVGKPIGAITGVDAMKFAGWQRFVAEYSKQFGRAIHKVGFVLGIGTDKRACFHEWNSSRLGGEPETMRLAQIQLH